MYLNFFIHSSVNGHSGYFHVLVIVNSAAMNIGVHVPFSIIIFSEYVLSSGIAVLYDSFIPPPFFFKDFPYCSPWWFYQFTFPPTVQESSLFSISSVAFIICRFFLWWPVWLVWGDILHCSFDINHLLKLRISYSKIFPHHVTVEVKVAQSCPTPSKSRTIDSMEFSRP